MVIRIQVNVFGREVAGPEGDGGIALLQAKVDVRVSILPYRCRDGFRIEGDRVTCFIKHRAIELEADLAGFKVDVCVAGSRDDTSPIRVRTGHRGLYQGAVGNGASYLMSFVPRATS